MAIDIPTGIDDFLKAEGSTDAQRADAIAVLTKQCEMVGDVVTLKATGEALDTEASRAWLQTNKPHLLPPIYERPLAERAFVDGNGMARNALVKQVGKAEADKIAQRYGLKSAHDTRRGTAPAELDTGKKTNEQRRRASQQSISQVELEYQQARRVASRRWPGKVRGHR